MNEIAYDTCINYECVNYVMLIYIYIYVLICKEMSAIKSVVFNLN